MAVSGRSSMYGFVVFLVVSLTLAVVWAVASSPYSNSKRQYRHFESRYGFGFEYPADWLLEYADTRPVFTAPKQTGSLRNLVVAVAQSTPDEAADLEEFLKAGLRSSNPVIKGGHSVTLGGLSAYEVDAEYDVLAEINSRAQTRMLATVINDKHNLVVLLMQAYVADFATYSSDFDHIVNTFSFKPPAISAGYRLYALDQYAISIEYPEKWQIVEITNDRIMLRAPDQPEAPNNMALTISRSPRIQSLDDWKNIALASFRATEGLAVKSDGVVTANDQTAYQVQYTYKASADRTDRGWELGYYRDGITATLTLVARDNTYDALEPAFQHIVGSFRWH